MKHKTIKKRTDMRSKRRQAPCPRTVRCFSEIVKCAYEKISKETSKKKT